jgi:hypothetical protein
MNIVPAITRAIDTMKCVATLKPVLRLAFIVCCAMPMVAAGAEQKTFATPDEAVDSLLAALEADDDAALVAIFGDAHKSLVVTPDRAANSETRAKAFAAMQTYHLLEAQGDNRRVLLIGDQAWPLPIPLVKGGERWRFATEEGEDEIVNRRIGANERNAIKVLRAYLDAQKNYAARDRYGDGVLQYAQRLGSTTGKHDGLYWPADAT